MVKAAVVCDVTWEGVEGGFEGLLVSGGCEVSVVSASVDAEIWCLSYDEMKIID